MLISGLSLLDGCLVARFLFPLLSSGLYHLWFNRRSPPNLGLNFSWPAWSFVEQRVSTKVMAYDIATWMEGDIRNMLEDLPGLLVGMTCS